jgi:hypothetical protein
MKDKALKFDVAMRDAAFVQKPVAWAYVNEDGECEQIEYGEPFNDPDVTLLYTTPPAAKRQWVRLSEEEIDEIFNNQPGYCLDHYIFAEDVMSKYEEKNAVAQLVVPDVLNPKDENPAYAAGWNDCRAEMLKERNNG